VVFSTAEVGATAPSGSVAGALVLELVMTGLLMFVIMAVATDKRATAQMAGLAIGGTVALCSLFGGPFSGASLNPARSLGPALSSGDLSSLWLYLLGPVTGAALGAIIYDWIRCGDGTGKHGCC
jgi:glycerol uptake facilitator-like aquaporin